MSAKLAHPMKEMQPLSWPETHYTLTKDPKQLFFWERFGGLQVRGATRLRTTDFGSAGARTSSGGYKIRGATRFGGLQDYEPPILGPATYELVLEAL